MKQRCASRGGRKLCNIQYSYCTSEKAILCAHEIREESEQSDEITCYLQALTYSQQTLAKLISSKPRHDTDLKITKLGPTVTTINFPLPNISKYSLVLHSLNILLRPRELQLLAPTARF